MSKKKHGQALKGYMKTQGMKRQHHLALDLGLSDATVSLYFHGKRSFSVKTALRVSAHTSIPLLELFK